MWLREEAEEDGVRRCFGSAGIVKIVKIVLHIDKYHSGNYNTD